MFGLTETVNWNEYYPFCPNEIDYLPFGLIQTEYHPFEITRTIIIHLVQQEWIASIRYNERNYPQCVKTRTISPIRSILAWISLFRSNDNKYKAFDPSKSEYIPFGQMKINIVHSVQHPIQSIRSNRNRISSILPNKIQYHPLGRTRTNIVHLFQQNSIPFIRSDKKYRPLGLTRTNKV